MSRPSTGARGLTAQGGAPPTASRAPTAGRVGSRAGSGRGTSKAQEALEALTQTLIVKMRQKFSALADDVMNQEIIAREVRDFMTTGGSVKVNDMKELEANIRAKLTGERPKRREWVKRAVDEWALISKVDQAEHEVEETTKVANAKKAALAVKKELDQQVLEKKARKVRLKEDEVEYYHQEQAQLAKWREEEKAKVNKKREAALALKKERDAQLVELKIREEKALNKKKLEEEEQKRKVLADHKEKRRQEQEHRENMREEMKRLQASNIEARKIRQAIKDEETALQLKYQEDYAKMLEAEEQKRADALKVFKAKQDRQEALGGVIGEYKRWIDPKIIEQNFKKNEAALDKEDKRRKDAVIKLNQEVKATLDRQMQEKEDIQAALDEQERKRVTAFMAKLELEKQKEREKDQASLEKRLAHKKSLQEQINARADAKRLRKGDMSGTERKMNAHMLAKAASTPGIKSK